MSTELLALIKQAILSPNNGVLLNQVRQRADAIAKALEEQEVEFSDEELRLLESHPEWTGTVYQVLAGYEEESSEEQTIRKAIQEIRESEEVEIGSVFTEVLIPTLPERFRQWDQWFANVPHVPQDYQAHLRGLSIVRQGMPYADGLIRYGITPGTFLEGSRGVTGLANRLIRTALKDHDRSGQSKHVRFYHWVDEHYNLTGSRCADLVLQEHSVSPEGNPAVPYGLLLAQVRGTPHCPPEAAKPLLHWMVEAAQLKPYFFENYHAAILDQEAVRLTQIPMQNDTELAFRWGSSA